MNIITVSAHIKINKHFINFFYFEKRSLTYNVYCGWPKKITSKLSFSSILFSPRSHFTPKEFLISNNILTYCHQSFLPFSERSLYIYVRMQNVWNTGSHLRIYGRVISTNCKDFERNPCDFNSYRGMQYFTFVKGIFFTKPYAYMDLMKN